MTDDNNAPVTRQAIAARDRSLPGKVTGRLRKAIAAMVWEGASRADAAKAAGLADHSLRQALKRPHVKRAYSEELDVLRTSERARNIHALVDVRDKSGNAMARVQAARTLEQVTEESATRAPAGGITAPGLTICIVNAPAPALGAATMIDVTASRALPKPAPRPADE